MLTFLALAAFAIAEPGAAAPPLPRAALIVLDDRAVKGQAAPALLTRTAADLAARTGVSVVLLSDAIPRLDAASRLALGACREAPCLAAAGRKLNADVVVTLRVTPQEGVFVVTVSRIAALAKVKTVDDTALARTEAETSTVLADSVSKLFPSAAAPAAPPAPAPR